LGEAQKTQEAHGAEPPQPAFLWCDHATGILSSSSTVGRRYRRRYSRSVARRERDNIYHVRLDERFLGAAPSAVTDQV
jgi:hypothetical protein